ncbi:hypothetical protein AC578_3667 [Pseudocercospora eumusae]|uniref:Peptidase C15, pyroglutamyl peptidase I-like protein n=1 Tax=Pseudocercospora eumusae TaxID=321146 RepID=A0A139GXB0_9PEZI|nr:hypothetical protein AC578_3667 [Pseudocercospora eumusae]
MAHEEHKVVVTALGPFGGKTFNPSTTLRDHLPERIERPDCTPIQVIKYEHDLRNTLSDMERIPKLWSCVERVYNQNATESARVHIDAMIHLGVHEDSCWEIEKQARRDGYAHKGDDGLFLPTSNGGKGERWEGLPWILTPLYDVESIVRRLDVKFSQLQIFSSNDPGRQYCGFLYYSSLATLYKRGEAARALLVHIPPGCTAAERIDEGVDLIKAVLCEMIDALS